MGVNGIYGLSGSGLDIESMVKVGMMSKQSEYDKMAQKYTLNEWKKADYIELNNQITTFNMSALTDYKLSSSTKARTAESSNELAVTATANATAPAMNHRVDVLSLSSNAYLISGKSMSDLTDSVSNISLKDIFFNGLKEGNQTVTSTYTDSASNAKQLDGSYLFNDGAITSTKITLNATDKNKIASVDYTNTDGTPRSQLTNISSQTTKLISGEKKASFTLTDLGIKLNLNVHKSSANSMPNYPTTFSFENLNGASSPEYHGTVSVNNGGWVINFTDENDSSKNFVTTIAKDGSVTVQTNITTTDPSTGASSSVVTKNFTESAAEANVTYSAGAKTETVTKFSGSSELTTTETRDNTGITSIDSAKFQTKEWGIIGKTADDVRNVSYNFINGKAKTVKSDDIAIAFRIKDGEGDDAHSFDLEYKYSDILDGKKTINDFVSEINSAASKSSSNVRASYDNVSGRFYLYNTKSSNEDKISITALNATQADNRGTTEFAGNVAMDFFNALGLKQSSGGNLIAPANYDETGELIKQYSDDGLRLTSLNTEEIVSGSYGKVKIDGVEYNQIKDNKVTVAGVTYNFLNTTGDVSGGATAEPVTVSATQDNEAIIDKVKSFVESYNKILGSLYEKYDEKNDSNYKPLTQSQKDSMKDEQVEKWEEKAKKGMLYHDSTLSSIIGQMRNAITASVEVDGKNYSVFSLGISTTGLKGQLTLDEEKLKNALDENGDVVYNVFSKLTTKTENGKEVADYDKSGVAQRLGDIFTNATKLLKSRAGSSSDIAEDSDLNNLLRELQTKMSNFKKMMSAFEDKLYKKYDAMEVALSKLGMQLNFITGGQ